MYRKIGIGILSTDYKEYNNKKEFVAHGEFASDWETRNFFISYNNNALKSVSVDSMFVQKAKIGFAPYLANYGSLHSWLIYEIRHMSEYEDNFTSNFILRLYKSKYLLEIGIDDNKNSTLNFIKRF